MNEEMAREIEKLQSNLQTIRKVAGWTTEELGERIGVTKQTISNLENKRTTLTKTQYIAIRAILDYEIATNSENIALPKVMEVLLNSEEEDGLYQDETKGSDLQNEEATEQREKKLKVAKMAASVSSLAMVSVASPAIAGIATVGWLAKMIGDNRKK